MASEGSEHNFRAGEEVGLRTDRANLPSSIRKAKRRYSSRTANYFSDSRDTEGLWTWMQTFTDYYSKRPPSYCSNSGHPASTATACPVALTPTIIKCFKRLVMHHIESTLSSNMDSFQFAYRSNRATEDALSTALRSVVTQLDRKDLYAVHWLQLNIQSRTPPTAHPQTVDECWVPSSLPWWLKIAHRQFQSLVQGMHDALPQDSPAHHGSRQDDHYCLSLIPLGHL